MKCHQYTIREARKLVESAELPFNPSELALKNSVIRSIPKATAESVILTYEWLKSMPSFPLHYFGIYFQVNGQEYLGGVLIYCHEYSMNTGIWAKYEIEGKMILLARGVCVWWTPKNTASYFIAKANKWILKNTEYRVVTATVDPMAGEVGTIYQASNWSYAGLMAGNRNQSGTEQRRFAVIIDGKKRGSRWVRRELGTMRKADILERYPDAKFVEEFRKRRYFAFLGKEGKKYKQNMAMLFHAYPSRDELNDMLHGHCAYIYKITNKINGKVYIGQTMRNIKERFNEYQSLKTNPYLKKSFNKHGIDNFSFEVIHETKNLSELNDLEILYIKQFDSTNRGKGYNLDAGGRNASPSQETLAKMSAAHKGRKQTADWTEKRIAKAGSADAKKYGSPKTEEEKLAMSEKGKGENAYWFGKKRDPEMVARMAATKTGVKMNPDAKRELLLRQGKQVEMTDTTGKVTIFESQTAASEATGISVNSISSYCKGKFKNGKGLLFRYV